MTSTKDKLHQIKGGAGVNCHSHAFVKSHVPEKFIPLLSKSILNNPKLYNSLEWVLKNVNPFTPKDAVERYANYLGTLDKTQEQVYLEGASQWPKGTKTVILAVDMENMGRGQVDTPYIDQVKEMLALAKKYKGIRLFVMVDPRSPHLQELYDLMASHTGLVYGIKLYPPMGYYPTDKKLKPFYELAMVHKWSVISHCTAKSPVYYSGKGIKKMLNKQDTYYKKSLTRKGKCSNFAHPHHLKLLALNYPTLKICAAHAGGSADWFQYCIDAVEELGNFYIDLSFTFDKKQEQEDFAETCHLYPKLATRSLLGNDYFMTQTITRGNPFYEPMMESLGTDLFFDIFVRNPKNFLKR